MKTPTTEEISSVALRLLSTEAVFCYLLGSADTPRFHSESDIDIAVYWKGGELSFERRVELKTNLEDQLGHPVDLISLNTIDVIYGVQVLETGRILFCHDPGLLLEWKASQLSKYPDFKRSRAVIENNILIRKKYV
jgi:predicted nucleotidyltransferase